MKLVYPACIYQNPKTQAYAVEVPDLPGCVTGGSTLAEAIFNGEDTASGWILDKLEDGKEFPSASTMEQIKPNDGGIVSYLLLDIDAYAEKYGNTAILKDVAIPAWLNTFVESYNLNLSRVLQDALIKIYKETKRIKE